MSTTIPWSTIVDAATAAAALLPPPANVIATIALNIARDYQREGCVIGGCPAELQTKLLDGDIPDGQDQLDSLGRMRASRR